MLRGANFGCSCLEALAKREDSRAKYVAKQAISMVKGKPAFPRRAQRAA
jgi:hypothetical protein